MAPLLVTLVRYLIHREDNLEREARRVFVIDTRDVTRLWGYRHVTNILISLHA